VENLTGTPVRTELRTASQPGSASVLHLTGPSLLAKAGVRIQGAVISVNGRLTPGAPEVVSCSAGGCPVSIAPYSAVLVGMGTSPSA
jgi:hypothetical protein